MAEYPRLSTEAGITVAGVIIVIVGAWTRRQSIRNYIETNISEYWINFFGYTGGFMQLGAVLAVSRGWLGNKSPVYHILSLFGSGGLLLNAFYYGANPAVVINTIWMSMNTVGIVEGISNIDIIKDLPPLPLGVPV